MRQICLAIVLLLIYVPVWGATYYVDATGGNDSNAGTAINSAWKTISKVNSFSFSPGDSILFKCGETWREQLTVPSSGSTGNPITFGAYGSGANPIINGANVITPGTSWSATVGKANVWQAAGVTATGYSGGDPKQVFFNGVRGIRKTSIYLLSANAEWFWSDNSLYVYADADPDTKWTAPGVEPTIRNFGMEISGKKYITVNNLKFMQGMWSGINMGDTPDSAIFVDNNAVSDNYQKGIRAASTTGSNDNITITNNTVFNNGSSGIDIYKANNSLIDSNLVYENSKLFYTGEEASFQFSGGIYIFGDDGTKASNNTVSNNTVHDNYGSAGQDETGKGIWTDTVSTGNIIKYNLTYGNWGPGIYIESSDGVSAYYNISYGDNPTRTQGGSIYIHGGTLGAHNNLVYNNTVYGGRVGIRIASNGVAGDVTGNLIKNNISYGNSVRAFSAFLGGENDGTMGSGNVYTYNAFGPEAANFIEWGNVTYKSTYVAWETAYGSTTHSVQGNPKFTSTLNFNLQSSSPCIDAGTDVGLTRDYIRNNKWGANWDIGAYEWRSNSRLPASPSSLKIIP
jgi:parallel beta-helix repeat protein